MIPRPIETTFQNCPDCGISPSSIGEVPFRCANCGYAHFFGPVAAVGGLVVNTNNELLMVRRAQDPEKGKWGLPGGFVDRGETIEQALEREVFEETGLKLGSSRYLISFPNLYDYQGVVAPVIDLFFVCQVQSDDAVSLDQTELDDFEWLYPTARRLQEMAFPSNRSAIEFWMQKS
jgi:mutator protein MutT